MKLIDVPIYTNEGELKFTSTITMEEAQVLLQFAINLKMAMAGQMGVGILNQGDSYPQQELDD